MSFFKGVIATLFLFLTLLLINLLQISSLIVKPFSPPLFRRVNRLFANTWWGLCAWGAEKIHGVRVLLSGDELPVRESSIVILNHQTMTDIPVLFSLAKSKGRLGDLKWFVKDVIKYVPGIGWGMLFLDCLFIKRNWMKDQDHIHRVFKNILDHSIPLWLVTFAEGTRLTPANLEQSRAYAAKQGLAPFRHLLIPRTKGFVVSTQSLCDHVDAVYDLTIGYVNEIPSLWQWVKGEVQSVHLYVRRFPKEMLPTEAKDLAQWLLDLFKEKDRLLENFYQNGVFSSHRTNSPGVYPKVFETFPSIFPRP